MKKVKQSLQRVILRRSNQPPVFKNKQMLQLSYPELTLAVRKFSTDKSRSYFSKKSIIKPASRDLSSRWSHKNLTIEFQSTSIWARILKFGTLSPAKPCSRTKSRSTLSTPSFKKNLWQPSLQHSATQRQPFLTKLQQLSRTMHYWPSQSVIWKVHFNHPCTNSWFVRNPVIKLSWHRRRY